MNLRDIIQPIEQELDTFNDHFREAMKSKVAFVDIIARYIVNQKGKKIRPTLVLLTAKACGEINDSTYRGASLVEILHTATLIHDDVVDDADTRRGFASINAVWKNKIAVLMGDYMLAKGLLLSLDNNDFQFLKITSDAVRRMSEAEILQIAKSRDLDLDETTYFKIISDKTASLLSTCTQIGAASVSHDQELLQRMRDFGENLGMVFQIRDDLLDYVGRKSITGKPTGLDMKEKKLTLPLIYSFTQAPRGQSRQILHIIKNGARKKELQHVVEFAHEFGGIEYTVKKAQHYSSLALAALEPLPLTPAKESLTKFVEFVMERSK
ncbi:MAG: polyprenyl synthetase family protein [Ignavibacteria bacterium]|nr:polyprenyl synthetase family protein [Ignavibacteria bacterium]MBI3766429.1 polyprenyl synthetase family protein [Ignavibacteriales bacterium]